MSAIVKYTGAGAIAPALVGKVKAFDSAPEMLTSFQGYYGFDPSAFAGMSEEELGAFVDSVSQKPEREAANYTERQAAQEAKSEERNRIKDLFAYGTRGKYGLPSSSSKQLSPATNNATNNASKASGWLKKWGGKAFDYFSGK